jgi:sigma-B regulation protein RsbU (phosphoserine phosphatase)
MLGHQFNDTVEALIRHQQEAEIAKIGRERLAQELRIGRAIQKSMLPTSLPDLPGIDISASYLPADEVSGDFYDFLLLPDGQLLIAIADVSGKGISACLYALNARGLLRAFATSMTNLSEMVRQMNRLLCQDSMESSLFVTIWVGIYDPKKLSLEYCNQGHFPSLLRRGDRIEELPGGGIALGVEEDVTPNMGHKQLQVGDRLILFTDGLVDAEDQKGTRLGQKRLQDYLQRTSLDTAENLLAGLAPLSLLDDVSIVMMRIDG